MKYISKSQASIFQNSDVCKVYEYPLGSKVINGALIEIKGRYPDSGNVMNQVCKEIVYVVKGSGKVVVEDREQDIQAGDSIFIDNNEKFCWLGDITIYAVCSPAYYPEQHEELV